MAEKVFCSNEIHQTQQRSKLSTRKGQKGMKPTFTAKSSRPCLGPRFLVVFGGRSDANTNHNTSIIYLDLNNVPSGWQSQPSLQIDVPQPTINGMLIKRLTPNECDMMYVNKSHLHVCEGYFGWNVTPLGVSML